MPFCEGANDLSKEIDFSPKRKDITKASLANLSFPIFIPIAVIIKYRKYPLNQNNSVSNINVQIVNGIIDDLLAKLPLLEPIMEMSPEIFPQVINRKVPEAKEIKATEFIEGWSENKKMQVGKNQEKEESFDEKPTMSGGIQNKVFREMSFVNYMTTISSNEKGQILNMIQYPRDL